MLFLIFGIALIVAPELLRRLWSRRENRLARVLSGDLRTRPSGPGGAFTRRDHLVGALRAAETGAGCFVIALVASRRLEHSVSRFWGALVFMAGVGSMMAAAMVLIALVRAAVGWTGAPEPPKLRGPVTGVDRGDGERWPKPPYIPAE